MPNECKSVTINPNMKFDDDDVCMALFGMSLYGLAHDIANDTSGKYADLYADDDGKGKDCPKLDSRRTQTP